MNVIQDPDALLTIAGFQVPEIPLLEISGNVGVEQIANRRIFIK
jgi:hypothetical protein